MENQALDLFTAQGGSKDHIFLGALGGTEAAVGSEFHTVVGDAWAQSEPPWPSLSSLPQEEEKPSPCSPMTIIK